MQRRIFGCFSYTVFHEYSASICISRPCQRAALGLFQTATRLRAAFSFTIFSLRWQFGLPSLLLHCFSFIERDDMPPNKSPEPTAVGACSSAVAVHVANRRWLSFFR